MFSSFFVLVDHVACFFGSGHDALSLPTPFPLTIFANLPLVEMRRRTSRSDFFLGEHGKQPAGAYLHFRRMLAHPVPDQMDGENRIHSLPVDTIYDKIFFIPLDPMDGEDLFISPPEDSAAGESALRFAHTWYPLIFSSVTRDLKFRRGLRGSLSQSSVPTQTRCPTRRRRW